MPYDYAEEYQKQNDSTIYKFLASSLKENNDILSEIEDKQPYLYRATNMPDGSVPYVQEKLIGASAAVNQYCINGNFKNTNGWSIFGQPTVSASNNTINLTLSDGTYARANIGIQRTASNIPTGHKILFYVDARSSIELAVCVREVNSVVIAKTISANTWTRFEGIAPKTQETTRIDIFNDTTFTGAISLNIKNVNCIDLTQMFGTAIADLAYSKEQASAGSGIAWLKSYGFFTKDYYPYNIGALQSVKTGSKKVVGKNLFNSEIKIESAQYLRCDEFNVKPGTYKLIFKNNSSSQIAFWATSGYDITDTSTKLVNSGSVVNVSYTVTGNGNVRFGFRHNPIDNNVAVSDIKEPMFIFTSEEDTSYKPYTSTTYPLDSNLELRGLYKLDANNNIVCDGDEYTPDGNVKRKYDTISNLGNLNWIGTTVGGNPAFKSDPITNAYILDASGSIRLKILLLSSKYITSDDGSDKTCFILNNDKRIYIRDTNYSDATEFKNSLNNISAIYLATSTTDTADSYQNPQIIHENGTEEFIDTRDYPLPVGHDTGYFTASDEKFFLPPVVDNDGRILYHDNDGFQFEKLKNITSKVEASEINGNIKIDGVETQVYDDSELQEIVDTDTTTITGNPLNFSTKSAQNAVNTDIVIDPVQDLHGYDKPWVGGAGKNLLPMTVEGIKANNTSDNGTWSGNVYTSYYGITYTILTDSDNNVTGIKVNGNSTAYFNFVLGNITTAGNEILNGTAQGSSGSSYRLDVYDTTQSKQYIDLGNGVTIADAGNYACRIVTPKNITVNNVIFYPMIRLSTETDASFAPYTNICPISPKEQITVQGCAENIWDEEWENGYIYNGNYYDSNSYKRSKNFIPVYAGLTYRIINITTDGQIPCYDKNQIYKSNIPIAASGQTYFVFTIPEGIEYIKFYNPNASFDNNIAILYPSTATSYSPYTSSNNLQIPLPNDFYGGTLNLESGELVVDRAFIKFDGSSDEEWTLESGTDRRVYTTILSSIIKPNSSATVIPNIISDRFETKTPNDIYSMKIGITVGPKSTSNVIYVNNTGTTMVLATWLSWLEDNNLQVVYELATPYTIHLTPHQLSLLKSTNNISTDAKTISVTYRNGTIATLDDISAPFKFVIDPNDGGVNIILK